MVPFKSGMVVVGPDFCGRTREVAQLREHLRACSRVCLLGERRIGKTSLVHETVRRWRGHSLIFIDLLGVRSATDVTRRVVEGIFRSATRSMVSKLLKSFAVLRPAVSIDPATNAPTLTLSPGTVPGPETLEGALDYMAAQKNTAVFCDEFQALRGLPEVAQTDVIARMRSRIQLHSQTPYVFAGSLRSEMDRLFFDHASPFYKSAVRFELGPLDRTEFGAFIRESFAAGRRSVNADLMDAVLERCHDVPGDVQRLCKCLWDESQAGDALEADMLGRALLRLFSEEERTYTILLENITGQQLQCLRALAEVGGAASMNGEFLSLTGIANNSSVQRAVNSLVKKRILFRDGKRYRFCDPFFGEWIRAKRM